MERIERLLKKDERYLRIKQSFRKLPQYSLPVEDYISEMKLLHKQRTLHKLDVASPNFARNLSSAATTDHSFRSRITEILVTCSSVRTNLAKTLESFEKYVLNQYNADLKSLRTKEERKAFVHTLMYKFHQYLIDVEALVEICKYYIDNIDKGGYMVRELVQAYSIVRKFEPG